jgi:hypothetical protein
MTVSRGLYDMHYSRWRRHGDTSVTLKPLSDTTEEAFKHYMPEPPPSRGCWPWRGTIADTGYGTFAIRGKRYGAHRIAYELFVGPIPKGLHIRHRCVGNRACVQPAHLLVGTPAQNVQDTVDQGRTASGERNGQAKLTDREVAEIRAAYATGGISQRELGVQYSVRQNHISRLVNGTRRKVHD